MENSEYLQETYRRYVEASEGNATHSRLAKEHEAKAHDYYESQGIYAKILRKSGIDPENPPAEFLDEKGKDSRPVKEQPAAEQPTLVETAPAPSDTAQPPILSSNKTIAVLSVFNGSGLLPKDVYDRIAKHRDDVTHSYIWALFSKQSKLGRITKENGRYVLTAKGREYLAAAGVKSLG